MVQKLKEALIQLSTELLTADIDKDVTGLYNRAREIYEKLAVLKFLNNKVSDAETSTPEHEIALYFQNKTREAGHGTTAVPKHNPLTTNPATRHMENPETEISEIPPKIALEQVFTEFIAKPGAIPTEEEYLTPVEHTTPEQSNTPSLNDSFAKALQIDLNDKLAFVKHLFNNDTENYNRVLSQLNTMNTEEHSINFISTLIKPEYNNWKGKEEYEARFIALIKRKFS